MYNPSRHQAREFLIESWRKRRNRLPASALEIIAGDVIALHPEYHNLLDNPDMALELEWLPESGDTNPFLHLSLHLAIEEQLSIDQPPGIAAAYAKLLLKHGDRHEAQHAVLECLGETLWRSQRDKTPIDGAVYLDLLQRAVNQG